MAMNVRTHRPVIDHAKCDGCAVCIRGCPAEIMLEMRAEQESLRGKIYDQRDRNIRINADKVFDPPPCQANCPIGQDVRGYIKLISKRRYREAMELIRDTNPLPSICGYICNRPCEEVCVRASIDDALSIRSLKRFVADYDGGGLKSCYSGKSKNKKVTIVGSGPAGLAAAHELAKMGYRVDVFESHSDPGGMLAWAIPSFRLPREILKRDIGYIKEMGVMIKTGFRYGPDFTIPDLKRDGADAIIIATGTMKPMKMHIEDENGCKGLMDCLSFLKGYAEHENPILGDQVLVVGGGNSAIDSARAAMRLGAQKVTIIYRRGPDEMPADPVEVKRAILEGVSIKYLTDPKRIIEEKQQIRGMECLKTELCENPEGGRKSPIAIPGSEFIVNADTIISAIGQEPDYEWMLKELPSENKRGNGFKLDAETMSTPVKGVFAAGDFLNGPTSVVEAMASGKKAAHQVAMYLSGKE